MTEKFKKCYKQYRNQRKESIKKIFDLFRNKRSNSLHFRGIPTFYFFFFRLSSFSFLLYLLFASNGKHVAMLRYGSVLMIFLSRRDLLEQDTKKVDCRKKKFTRYVKTFIQNNNTKYGQYQFQFTRNEMKIMEEKKQKRTQQR